MGLREILHETEVFAKNRVFGRLWYIIHHHTLTGYLLVSFGVSWFGLFPNIIELWGYLLVSSWYKAKIFVTAFSQAPFRVTHFGQQVIFN